jgi:hypothetical protein
MDMSRDDQVPKKYTEPEKVPHSRIHVHTQHKMGSAGPHVRRHQET